MNISSLALLAVLGHPGGPGVDFFYVERLSTQDNTDVNFGLHGECRDKGISMDAQEGVLISEVRANGKAIEPYTINGYRHGAYLNIIERPGPSFFYHMPLSHLESKDPYDPAVPPKISGIQFVVPGLPRRLEITYRLRCADGSLSRTYVTRGKRYPLPAFIKGSDG